MDLGVAYLWLGRYQAAFTHFEEFNRKPPRYAITFGMAGAAKWCLSQPEEAVDQWQAGLKCDFADSGGAGIKIPLLLFFASITRPALFPTARVERLLQERSQEPRAAIWPGPLAKFVLGQHSDDQLRQECERHVERYGNDETPYWHSDFYKGVLAAKKGDAAHFSDAMKRAAQLTWADFDNRQAEFYAKVWQEEFFLARHESSSVGKI